MLPDVCRGFTGETASLQEDRQRIGGSVFHILIPIVLKGIDLVKTLILIREAQEVVGNAEKDDIFNYLKRVCDDHIPMLTGVVVAFLLAVDLNARVGILLFEFNGLMGLTSKAVSTFQ